jgi:DNA-binding transcriptional MerR regulator
MNNKEKLQPEKEFLKIGTVASRSNVLIPTVRYYIGQGLLKPKKRSIGGFMLFNGESVERIKEIKRLQKEERLSIIEIKRKLS